MKRILTADDSNSMRKLVSYVLENEGYDVVSHCDGLEALQWALSNPADLVISDVNMPNMDGFSLVKSLRELPNYEFIPIIMLTTESTADSKSKGKEAGATGWIVKPFNPEKLLVTVAKIIDK